jgi:serine/threonine-protein kinase SRPK3
MKIKIASPKSKSHEVEILQSLSRHASTPSGRDHVLELLDSFQINGPNGTHDVLVTDILVSLSDLRDLEALDSRRAAYHKLLGLAYLHRQNIVHGGAFDLYYSFDGNHGSNGTWNKTPLRQHRIQSARLE